MANIMDNLQFTPVSQSTPSNGYCTFSQGVPCDLKDIIQRARQNPQWLEQEVQRINPQGYQLAMQIRNGANPIQTIMQMAQTSRIHPSVLQMLGLK